MEQPQSLVLLQGQSATTKFAVKVLAAIKELYCASALISLIDCPILPKSLVAWQTGRLRDIIRVPKAIDLHGI